MPSRFGKTTTERLTADTVGSVDYPQIRLNALLRCGEAVERRGIAETESADIETYPRSLALDGYVRGVGGAAASCVGRDESVVARLCQCDASRCGAVAPLERAGGRARESLAREGSPDRTGKRPEGAVVCLFCRPDSLALSH